MADAPGPERPLPADGGRARLRAAGRAAAGGTSRSGTASAACSRTTAASSRSGRATAGRCFATSPSCAPLGELMPPHSALDGEIVIARDGALDFDAMQMRLHPAESRVRKLAGEIPATFVAFDLLLWKGKPVHERPIEKRRAELEKIGDGFELSPVSDDVEQGREWLQTLQAAGFDGVVAKKLGLPVPPRLARRRRQGQAAQDGRLRRRRDPLEEGRPRDDRDAPARPLRRRRRSRLRRLGRGRREEPGGDRGEGAAARRQEERPPLQRAEPLGQRRARGDGAEAEARRRGALRQAREAPLPPRHAPAPLPPGQGSGASCTWREVRPPRPTTSRSRICSRTSASHFRTCLDRVGVALAPFFARDGWTRFGSPGIFGKFGGYGASPLPSASSRSTHSSSLRRSQTASSMPAWTSPSSREARRHRRHREVLGLERRRARPSGTAPRRSRRAGRGRSRPRRSSGRARSGCSR